MLYVEHFGLSMDRFCSKLFSHLQATKVFLFQLNGGVETGLEVVAFTQNFNLYIQRCLQVGLCTYQVKCWRLEAGSSHLTYLHVFIGYFKSNFKYVNLVFMDEICFYLSLSTPCLLSHFFFLV